MKISQLIGLLTLISINFLQMNGMWTRANRTIPQGKVIIQRQQNIRPYSNLQKQPQTWGAWFKSLWTSEPRIKVEKPIFSYSSYKDNSKSKTFGTYSRKMTAFELANAIAINNQKIKELDENIIFLTNELDNVDNKGNVYTKREIISLKKYTPDKVSTPFSFSTTKNRPASEIQNRITRYKRELVELEEEQNYLTERLNTLKSANLKQSE
jgi:hypothetical protein